MDDRPKLRPLQPIPVNDGGQQVVCLRDPTGLSNKTIALSPRAFFLAALCDGEHTIRDIQTAYVRRFGDLIMTDQIRQVIEQLDEALFLENARFEGHRRKLIESFARARRRKASHAGTAYPSDPAQLRALLDGFFTDAAGPGPIDPTRRGSGIAAVAAPPSDVISGASLTSVTVTLIAWLSRPRLPSSSWTVTS